MLQLASLHPTIGIQQQLAGPSEGPVVLLNLFTVAEADAAALVRAWRDDAEYFKRQSGFISAQLHEGLGGKAAYLNYAVWESLDAFRAAFANPEFQRKLAAYPDSVVAAPHLFRKLAVPDVCLA
jgi:heme-degrading monooxygenase HmoA